MRGQGARGGARPGTGPKMEGGHPRELLTVRVSHPTMQKINSLAESTGKSKGRIIDELFSSL